MKLIADSGSSKTHWVLLMPNGSTKEFYSKGLNPFFIDKEFVHLELQKAGFESYREKILEIVFYGAGCSNIERNFFLENSLSQYFTSAVKIKIDHDMMGASIALFGNQKGIACILGTGSNSCVYNGVEIIENMPAIGYILGDEGGGAYFGKEILRQYIYKNLPIPIQNYMHDELKLDKEVIFESVYKNSLPNRYLASFSTIYTKFKDDEFIQKTLHNGFDEFVKYHILCYKESSQYPLGFVGSIAYYFKHELELVLKKYNLKADIVLKNPIDGILKYNSLLLD